MEHHFTKAQKYLAFLVLVAIFVVAIATFFTVQRISNEQAYLTGSHASETDLLSLQQQTASTSRPLPTIIALTSPTPITPWLNACINFGGYIYQQDSNCLIGFYFKCSNNIIYPPDLLSKCTNVPSLPGMISCYFGENQACFNRQQIHKMMNKMCSCPIPTQDRGIQLPPGAQPQ